MHRLRMEAGANLQGCPRGADLLLDHCAAVGRLAADREPATSRLERALGRELARMLVLALVPCGRRGRISA